MDPATALLKLVGGEQGIYAFFLVLARVSPLFVLAPLFSNKAVPARARGICAVALAIGMSPAARGSSVLPGDAWMLGGLLAKEVLVGAAFAYAVGAVLAAVQAAGAYLDTFIGFSFGSLVDPVTGNQSSVLSNLYTMIMVIVFIAIAGDAWVLQGLARTYELVPLADAPAMGSLVEGTQRAFLGVLSGAIEVAAPVMLAIIITDAAFGVVSRVMPQLNVFAVGFPAKVLVGFLLIGVSLPFVASWFGGQLQESVSTALRSFGTP